MSATNVNTSMCDEATHHANNVITYSLSNIHGRRFNIYVDLKIPGSADKENIIRRKIADKSYYFVGEDVNHCAYDCNDPFVIQHI